MQNIKNKHLKNSHTQIDFKIIKLLNHPGADPNWGDLTGYSPSIIEIKMFPDFGDTTASHVIYLSAEYIRIQK